MAYPRLLSSLQQSVLPLRVTRGPLDTTNSQLVAFDVSEELVILTVKIIFNIAVCYRHGAG